MLNQWLQSRYKKLYPWHLRHSLCLGRGKYGWVVFCFLFFFSAQGHLWRHCNDKKKIKAQIAQLQGKCYQKVEPLSLQAVIVSFYNPATCFGKRFKSRFSFQTLNSSWAHQGQTAECRDDLKSVHMPDPFLLFISLAARFTLIPLLFCR